MVPKADTVYSPDRLNKRLYFCVYKVVFIGVLIPTFNLSDYETNYSSFTVRLVAPRLSGR